jgi:RHS repeat-associated protein
MLKELPDRALGLRAGESLLSATPPDPAQLDFHTHLLNRKLLCGHDQVGTLKLITDAEGRQIKHQDFDSFGNLIGDTNPEFAPGLGFSGSLTDPDTGLVHLGYREYDPVIGRFISPDPLGDTGGDHDLYDYCVDDPITLSDPAGLFPILALLGIALAAKAGGALAGLGISHLAASGVDVGNMVANGKIDKRASEAVAQVSPKVLEASALSSLPLMAAVGGGLGTAVARQAGAYTTAYVPPAVRQLFRWASLFSVGYFTPPISPGLQTAPEQFGTLTSEAVKYAKGFMRDVEESSSARKVAQRRYPMNFPR